MRPGRRRHDPVGVRRRRVRRERQAQLAVAPARRCGRRTRRSRRPLLDEQDGHAAVADCASASKTTRRRSERARATARRGAGRRGGEQRPRDRELLLLAARERPGLTRPANSATTGKSSSTQSRSRRRPSRARAGRRGRVAGSPRRSARRRCGGPRGRARRRLARRPPGCGRERRGRAAGSSPQRPDEAHDREQRRRLPGAVGADQPDDLARGRRSRLRPRTAGTAP